MTVNLDNPASEWTLNPAGQLDLVDTVVVNTLLAIVAFVILKVLLVTGVISLPLLAGVIFERGGGNGSYLVPVTMRAMADVRGDDLATLCEAVDANTEAAFGGPW